MSDWDWTLQSQTGRLRTYVRDYCTRNHGPDAVFRNDDGSCPEGNVPCGTSSSCCRPAKNKRRDDDNDDEIVEVRTPTLQRRRPDQRHVRSAPIAHMNQEDPRAMARDARRQSFRDQRRRSGTAARKNVEQRRPVILPPSDARFGMRLFTNRSAAPTSVFTSNTKKKSSSKKSKKKNGKKRHY